MTQMLFRAEEPCMDNLVLNTIEAGFTDYVEQKVQEYCHHSITCAVNHISSHCSVLTDEGKIDLYTLIMSLSFKAFLH